SSPSACHCKRALLVRAHRVPSEARQALRNPSTPPTNLVHCSPSNCHALTPLGAAGSALPGWELELRDVSARTTRPPESSSWGSRKFERAAPSGGKNEWCSLSA